MIRDSRDVQIGDRIVLCGNDHDLTLARVTSAARGAPGTIMVETEGAKLILRSGELLPVLVETRPA